jgi:hypothetical protein
MNKQPTINTQFTNSRKPLKIFGSLIYQDLAVLKPRKIAIELTHSDKGQGLRWLSQRLLSMSSASMEKLFRIILQPEWETGFKWTERQRNPQDIRRTISHTSYSFSIKALIQNRTKNRNKKNNNHTIDKRSTKTTITNPTHVKSN